MNTKKMRLKKDGGMGFTLIELLIVIALLGALAVGLLAALDPFEQFKKGNDTGARNTAAELHGSIIRYYAIKNYLPWCTDETCTSFEGGTEPSAQTLAAFATAGTLQKVIDAGELKSDFANLAQKYNTQITVTGVAATNSVTVCFEPNSKSFIADPNTKYNNDGSASAPGTACATPSTSGCWWCLQ